MFSGFHSQRDQFAHFNVLPSVFILNYTTLDKNFPQFLQKSHSLMSSVDFVEYPRTSRKG